MTTLERVRAVAERVASRAVMDLPTLRPLATVRGAGLRDRPRLPIRVTVVITNYGYARFLPFSIGSALAQEGVDVDVVVVDDASPDDSAEVLERMAAADPRIRVVLNPTNRRAVETFNTGLELATGEYIVRLDADDVLAPGSLARAVALGEMFPSVGLIYGRPVHFSTVAPPAPRGRLTGWTVWSGDDWVELQCRTVLNPISSPEPVIRRSVADRVGGLHRDLPHAHDMEWWLRIAAAGDVGHVDGVDQAWQRYHSTSFSAREVDSVADLANRERVFEILLAGGSDRDVRLLAIARRALADEAVGTAVQAYVEGRGAASETDAYLEFARRQGVPMDELASAKDLALAERLGPRRAPRSMSLQLRSLVARARAHRTFVHRQTVGL